MDGRGRVVVRIQPFFVGEQDGVSWRSEEDSIKVYLRGGEIIEFRIRVVK
jgi:hypothetical protein